MDVPPLRVLHVAETAQGGVGSYIEDIVALQVARYGESAVRAVLPREHAVHFKRLPAASLRLFDIAASGRSASMLKMALRAFAEMRRFRPEVVHLHSTYAGFVLRPLLALLPGRPRIVYCAHGWAFDREASARSNRWLARIERWWSHACDAVVRSSLRRSCSAGTDANSGSDDSIRAMMSKLCFRAAS